MMHKQTAAVLSVAALAAAQISISQQCQQAISGLSSNTDASACLAINQLTNIFVVASGTSVLTPVDNWLKAFCKASDCSDATLESVATTLLTACSADLGGLNVPADTIVPYVQKYFPLVKQAACLADTTADAFCVSETGHDYEDAIGKPLSLDTLFGIATTATSSQSAPVNASVVCTPCLQGELALVHEQVELAALYNPSDEVASVCGADFAASTTMPANIVVGTGAAVPKGDGSNTKNDDKGGAASTLAVAGSLAAVTGAVLVGLLA